MNAVESSYFTEVELDKSFLDFKSFSFQDLWIRV